MMRVVSMAKRSWICAAAMILVVATLRLVDGAPFLGIDLDTCCDKVYSPKGFDVVINCCLLDNGKPLRDFEFPTNLPMRVRRPLHTLDQFRMSQLERGIALMKALPDDDPRSWYQQNKLHCAYTTGVYQQIGGPRETGAEAQVIVHTSWFFYPFHAWYVYFVERIIAKLVKDDTFAMPYWAWDMSDGDQMPHAFMNRTSTLWDSMRYDISPTDVIDLTLRWDYSRSEFADVETQRMSNNYQMRRAFDESISPEVFFGGRYVAGDDYVVEGSPFEVGPHLGVHFWIVDYDTFRGENMGQTYVAANDPVFNTHHSQVDRLWRLWLRELGGKNLDDPDYLNAQFFFFDENADFVRVNVSGSLDAAKMRVSYEEVEKSWLQNDPRVTSIRARGNVKYAPVGYWRKAWRILADTETAQVVAKFFREPKVDTNAGLFRTGAVSTASISRPSAGLLGRSRAGSSEEFDEVLVVSGVVRRPHHLIVLLRIFVELPEADSSTPQDCLESMGQIYISPTARDGDRTVVNQKFKYKTGVGKKIRSLGIEYLQSLKITFVSDWDFEYDAHVSVEFTDIRMEVHVLK